MSEITKEVAHTKCNSCKCYRSADLFLNAKGRRLKSCTTCRDKRKKSKKKEDLKNLTNVEKNEITELKKQKKEADKFLYHKEKQNNKMMNDYIKRSHARM